eukprot:5415736-Prymnesium_polylepis.1
MYETWRARASDGLLRETFYGTWATAVNGARCRSGPDKTSLESHGPRRGVCACDVYADRHDG